MSRDDLRAPTPTDRPNTDPSVLAFDPAPPALPVWARWAIVGFIAVYAILLATLPDATALANATGEPAAEPSSPFGRLVLAFAHLPLIACFLFVRWATLSDPGLQPKSELARRVWRQLLSGLTFLAVAWFTLYVWLTLVWSHAPVLGAWAHGPRGEAVADLLNTAGSLAFFYLYLVLDMPSVPERAEPDRHRSFRRALGTVSAVCAAVALLAPLGRLGHFPWDLGPLAGSLLAAIAMMYFFGRFDYRYMKVKRWMIAPLYLYVALQVAWHGIAPNAPGAYPVLVLSLALLCKAYLFAMLVLWMRDRTLQKYLDFAAL